MPLFSPSKDWIFISLKEEALPLLKRGFIPFWPATSLEPVWHHPDACRAEQPLPFISEEQYQQHLLHEYQRLPNNLQGLFSQEDFIKQAEAKRGEIKAALLQKQQVQSQQREGRVEDWWVQRFYSSAYSPQSWQNRGWDTIWLGLNSTLLETLELKPVCYQMDLPASFPECLLVEHPDFSLQQEQRCVLAAPAIEKWVALDNQKVGLVKMPAKSLSCALLGAAVNPALAEQFIRYWKQDLRYKSLPVAQMQLHLQQHSWQFYSR